MIQLSHIALSRWEAVIVAFVVTAAVSDIAWRRIPRWLTLAALVCGLLYHAVYGGIVTAIVAALIGFASGVALFQLGAIGGGDVKLIAALGAMLGFSHWVFAMEVSILASALIALAQAAVTGRLRQTIGGVGDLMKWLFTSGGKKHPLIHVGNSAKLRAPFGAAAALGTLIAIWRV